MTIEARYDAFISYSHAHDRALGPVLQAHLERFAKPWYRIRALKIFCDTINLAASPALWTSIEDALKASQWFILLTSPEAAESSWVNREVQWWLDHRSVDRLLIIATSPGLAWDENMKDWATDAPVPPALRGAFASEPHWVELGEVPADRNTLLIPNDRVADVAAPIRGMQKDVLVGEHVLRHRRTMRLAWGVAAFLLVLSVGLAAVSAVALYARQQAISERNFAASGQLAEDSEALGDTDPVVSRLESLAAWHIRPSSQTRYAMLNVAARPETATLTSRYGPVQWITFLQGGKVLATLTSGGMVQLWDISTGRQIRSPITGATRAIEVAAAFSADGKILATERSSAYDAPDGPVRLWNVATGKQAGVLPRSSAGAQFIALSPDGKTLAEISMDNTVQLFDTGTLRQIPGPDSGSGAYPNLLAFSPNGKTLAIVADNDAVRLWDIDARRQIGKTFGGSGMGISYGGISDPVAFSPNGKTLATIDTGDNTVHVWNVATHQEIVSPSTGAADSVAFSQDGSILAIGGENGILWLWNVADRAQIGSLHTSSTAPIDAVAFSPDGKTLVTGGDDGIARLWNLSLAAPGVISLPPPNKVTGFPYSVNVAGHAISNDMVPIALSPNGKILAINTPNEEFMLWDTVSRKWLGGPLPVYALDVFSTAFSPDSKTLAIGYTDGSVLLWDVATDRQIGKLEASPGMGRDAGPLAFSRDGKTLAVVADTVELWDIATRHQIGRIITDLNNGDIDTLAFSPLGKTLAIDAAGTAQLWDLGTYHQIGGTIIGDGSDTSDGGSSVTGLMAFSPNGKILATGNRGKNDGTTGGIVQLWDVASGQEIGDPIASADAAIEALAFSPDSKTLAISTTNGTVDLWDMGTGHQIGDPLDGNSDSVGQVVFSPDGITLEGISGTMIEQWDVSYLVNAAHYLCTSTGGSVTHDQWEKYVQSIAYQNVCP